jgi:hypothetical protein
LFTLAAAMLGLALSAAPAAADDKGDKDSKLSCRRESGVGSRLGSRICLTRAQWREREKLSREGARATLDNAEREAYGRPMNSGERSTSISPP